MELFRLENIKKEYQNGEQSLDVLKGISFSIVDGDFVSFMGRSGAGKSTLLQIIGCLDNASSVKYIFDQMPIHEMSDDQMAEIRNKKIGFVFQTFNLVPRVSVFQNVELPLIYKGVPKRKRKEIVDQAISAVGLSDRAGH